LDLLASRVSKFIITLTAAAHITYPRYQKTRQEVESAQGIVGSPLPAPKEQPATQHTLRYLADHLFTLSREYLIPTDTALILREAPDRDGKVRTALRWLKQQIVWRGATPNQVALLARDISPYRAFISQIAAEVGSPIRLINGQPLAHSPVITTRLPLLRLHLPTSSHNQPSLDCRLLIAAWRSPYSLYTHIPHS
jgi:hypothetical protein